MSDKERDARLGLTGLTPEQREERIRQLERELARKQGEARTALERSRAGARAKLGEQVPPTEPRG